ncbi:hypothetical protein ABMA28_003478 [Loxostege sticticalis]|uniref:Reverse transcriptase domain-containing protein n=1 Tax=Loxostege sticticalis TaxID=481309 RepID=A0ABD0T0L5_LOXSC
MSFHEREKVRNIVEELLQNDIVQESQSNYASPVLLVKKKNGEARLCVDFRGLNSKTVKDKYPLPVIEDQISNLSGNVFFTTLDLASGYYQVPMANDSRHLTAFVTPDGHYEFKRMPFGLANAPAVFQRTMNKILAERFNQTILTALSTQNFNKVERDWDTQLGKIQWGINNTVNASTKKAPAELLFGMKLNIATENKISSARDDILNQSVLSDREKLRKEASENIKNSQEKQKTAFNFNRKPAKAYVEGDLVKITKVSFSNDGKSKKLLPKFIGPYKVVKSLGNDRYQISDIPGFSRKRPYDTVVSVDRMRPWIHLKTLEINSDVNDSTTEESGSDHNDKD